MFARIEVGKLERQVQRHLKETRTPNCIGNEPDVLAGRRRIRIARIRVEAWVQGHVVVGSVEARMVKQVENIHFILELETLIDVEHFLQRKIESRLEGSAKDV